MLFCPSQNAISTSICPLPAGLYLPKLQFARAAAASSCFTLTFINKSFSKYEGFITSHSSPEECSSTNDLTELYQRPGTLPKVLPRSLSDTPPSGREHLNIASLEPPLSAQKIWAVLRNLCSSRLRTQKFC